MASGQSKKAPKPRVPAKSKGASKGNASGPESANKPAASRVTTAQLASRLDRVAEAVERVEGALAPQQRAADVAAEEHALLNLLDAIVDRRTEALLLPVARLAVGLDRAAGADEGAERDRLVGEARGELAVVLEALGLEAIRPRRGEELAPMLHEEVDQVEDPDLDDGLVAELVRAGYRIRGGRVLVPALVTVSCWAES